MQRIIIFYILIQLIHKFQCQLINNADSYMIIDNQEVSSTFSSAIISQISRGKVSTCLGKCNQMSACNVVSIDLGSNNCVLYSISNLEDTSIMNSLSNSKVYIRPTPPPTTTTTTTTTTATTTTTTLTSTSTTTTLALSKFGQSCEIDSDCNSTQLTCVGFIISQIFGKCQCLSNNYFYAANQTCLPCPDSWTLLNNQCYKVFSTAVTYNAAISNCANLGGYLALASQQSNYNSLANNNFQFYWIDARVTSTSISTNVISTGNQTTTLLIGLCVGYNPSVNDYLTFGKPSLVIQCFQSSPTTNTLPYICVIN